jgi:hypothetical protein
MKSTPRRTYRWLALCLAVAALIAGGWAFMRPRAPDPNALSAKDAVAFLSTDDYSRLSEAERTRYARELAERMRREKFADILRVVMNLNPRMKTQWAGIRSLSEDNKQKVRSAWLRMFLDKFYDLPPAERQAYLTMMALADRTGWKNPGIPSPQQFKNELSLFLTREPPGVQARMGQLMIDVSRTRTGLGLPPF